MSGDPIETSVKIDGKTGAEALYVGGHLLPCRSAIVELAYGHVPALTVRLPIADGLDVDLEHVRVLLDDQTRHALSLLGWSRPVEWREFDETNPPPTGILLWVYVPESKHNYASDRGVKLAEWDGSRFYKKVRADHADSVAREAWNWGLDASHWAIVPVPDGPAS